MQDIKDALIDLKDWFFNLEVPIFDKICAITVGIFLMGLLGTALFLLVKMLFTNPKLFFMIGFGTFLAISMSYLICKYLD